MQQLMRSPHFPQSLLFAGPKGTGKTSVARIIGAMLNDPSNNAAVEQRFFTQGGATPLNLNEPDPNSTVAESIFNGQSYIVQELDAASNRGIDDVRALKERSALPPTQGRVSVFILDEVHMMTQEAFNALLKLLEEPPPHVVFILATTELQKVPPTIASRCHLIQFQKASAQELSVPLQTIILDQALSVDSQTVELIAQLADGSFRDAVKLLQQYVQQVGTTRELSQLADTLAESNLTRLIQAVVDKNDQAVVLEFEKLRAQGTDEQFFLHALVQFLHQDLLKSLEVVKESAQFSEKVSRFFLQALSQPELLKPAMLPFLRLELLLLSLIERSKSKGGGSDTTGSATAAAQKNAPQQADQEMVVLVEPAALNTVLTSISQAVDRPQETVVSTTATQSEKQLGNGQLLCEKWQELVSKASQYNYGWAALLRSAQPVGGGEGEVVVRVFYSFHKEQLLQHKWLQFWEALTQELAGGVVTLDCIVEKLSQADLSQPTPVTAPLSLEALAVDALMH